MNRILLSILAIIVTTSSLWSQEGSFLDVLRERLIQGAPEKSDAEKEQDRKNFENLFQIVSQGVHEVIRALPEDSQQAIKERRAAMMDAIASGFVDLKGEDIERWLENSDNVMVKSLSRDPDSPSVDAESGLSRLPAQWWYGKEDHQVALLLTSPPEPIVRREDLPGPPVWYVNGIATTQDEGMEQADALAAKVGRRVHLLHNPTFMEPPHSTGLEVEGFGNDDLSECLYDRLWPAMIVNRLEKVGDHAGLLQIINDGQTLQGNPTTRQLAHVLLTSKEPVDLVTHSQGCIIARNAFFTMAMLQQRKACEQRIAWIAAGIPLNDKEVFPMPNQSSILDVGEDPVAKIIGLRGGTREYKGSDHSFTEQYLEQIQPSQLWRPVTEQPRRAKI